LAPQNKLYGRSTFALCYLHLAIVIGNDGRRPFDYAQDVKACAITFNLLLPKAARSSRFFIGACAAALKAFTNLSTSVPSLDFWLPFYQEKGKSPSAAVSRSAFFIDRLDDILYL